MRKLKVRNDNRCAKVMQLGKRKSGPVCISAVSLHSLVSAVLSATKPSGTRNMAQCSSPLNNAKATCLFKVITTGQMSTVLPGTGFLHSMWSWTKPLRWSFYLFIFKLSTSLTRGLKHVAFSLQKHLKCNMLMLVWSLVHFHKKPTISPTTP